jgi:hypothetical protein
VLHKFERSDARTSDCSVNHGDVARALPMGCARFPRAAITVRGCSHGSAPRARGYMPEGGRGIRRVVACAGGGGDGGGGREAGGFGGSSASFSRSYLWQLRSRSPGRTGTRLVSECQGLRQGFLRIPLQARCGVRPRAHVLFLSGAGLASAVAPALVCSALPPSLRAGAYFLLSSFFGAAPSWTSITRGLDTMRVSDCAR